MIKKIPIANLQLGMFVHNINRPWLEHPFLHNQFLVKDPKTLHRILGVGSGEIYIDTDRGSDIAPEQEAVAGESEAVDHEMIAELKRLAAQPRPVRGSAEDPTSFEEEVSVARATMSEATGVVASLMHSIRAGRQFALSEAERVVSHMADSIFRNPSALMGLTRIRRVDHYTFEHSVSVAVFMLSFGRELNLDRQVVRDIGIGGLLHDIGKTRIPIEILNKPGRLTEEEYAIMKEHVAYGRRLVAGRQNLSPTSLAVLGEHHERFDGSGYPEGLKGEEISLYGQMAAIVDVYDAVTTDRSYHQGEPPTQVLKLLLGLGRNHFKLPLVHHFIRCVGIYPVGSLVQLHNGLLALVTEQGRRDLMHPKVRVIYDIRARSRVPPEAVDLATPPDRDGYRIVGTASEQYWGIRDSDYLDLPS